MNITINPRNTLAAAVLAAAFAIPTPGHAAYGIQDFTATPVAAASCVPTSHLTEYGFDLRGWLNKSGGPISFIDFACPVDMPSGAKLQYAELEACDGDSSGSININLFVCPQGNDASGSCTNLATASTGNSETPGCGFFSSGIIDHTVDNFNNRYFQFVTDIGTSSTTKYRGTNVFWKRQISPAPATATFNDVPTSHPFFQHVEALARSGITAGCGGGNYCPAAAVSRGEMAVFLAKALGLHWPD